MKNLFKAKVRANTVTSMLSDGFTAVDDEYLILALKKAEIWMRNAYGRIDWEQYLGECVDVTAYYSECLHAPNAPDTFNRQTKALNHKGRK